MFIIDGMDPVEACYEFAGMTGLHPKGLTLRELWMMADGRARQRRLESYHLIALAFQDGIDVQRFVETGQIAESCVGKPLELSPEMEAKVQKQVEELRRQNPDLPTPLLIGGR